MAKADHHRITKSFRSPILKNANAATTKTMMGDHDRKDEAFHALSETLR
jgi:hypothetical protein